MAHNVGRAGPGPQLGWAVPDMGRARNCVLWAGLLGTAQMYTYSLEPGKKGRKGRTDNSINQKKRANDTSQRSTQTSTFQVPTNEKTCAPRRCASTAQD